MTKVLRFVGTALAGGVAAFFLATASLSVSACDPVDGTEDAGEVTYCEEDVAGCCKKATECGENRFEWICTPAGKCVGVCESSADCAQGELCEDAVCRPPACGNDGECGDGQQCIGGKCEAAVLATSVASCEVLPTSALLNTGATKTFSVVAKDADGQTLAFKGDVTWSVDQATRAAVAGAVVTGGAEAGAVKVQAKVGTVDCAAADVVNFEAVAADTLRVVVADLNGQGLIADATVVVDDGEPAVTDASGVVTFATADLDAADELHTISVFHDTYAWVTVYETSSKDVLVYTKQAQEPARFTGKMGARQFDDLSSLTGTVHLALQGGSIAGNLFDIELATLLGETVPTEINLGSQAVEAPLPEGTVIGLGENMFKEEFAIVSSPGVRTLWGLGGNAEFSAITEALGPAISGGGDLDIGSILTKLLPMLGQLQSGALTGVTAEAGAISSINDTAGISTLKLDTLLRLRVLASVPDLPTFLVAGTVTDEDPTPEPVETPFEGAIVLGGALNGAQGLVPMGLTAGIDANADGKVDADDIAGTDAGTLALRVAPLHSGMENSKYAVLSLAASFGGLIGGGEADGPGIVLSGLVTYPDTLSFNEGAPTELSLGDSFLDVPDLPVLADRTLSAGSTVAGASFQRLSVGSAGEEWLVYFAPGADVNVTLPVPPDGFTDRLVKVDDGSEDFEQPQALLHSVRLGDSGLTYDQVVGFDSDNLDDLSARVDAFSVIQLKR